MTKINLEYFGMPGSGATVKEAKLDAGKRISEALEGSYAPFVLNHRGKLLIASRNPRFGWGYRFYDEGEMPVYFNADQCSCGFDTRDECLLAAVRHLADVTHIEGERDSPLFDALGSRLAERERETFAYNMERNDTFQARYRDAIARGMKDGDAHDYAGMNPARRDLWESAA